VNTFRNQIPSPDQVTLNRFASDGPGNLAGQCLNMQGISVSEYAAPLHFLFEKERHAPNSIFTIGIGDGGNEIGMGSIPWRIIADNILSGQGGKIACRVATDATIVSGISNWAGYALVAGLYLYLNLSLDYQKLFSDSDETKLIEKYFQTKSAVDGKLGYPAMSVDGIDWEVHRQVIKFIGTIVNAS
jgi:hypothetical protein